MSGLLGIVFQPALTVAHLCGTHAAGLWAVDAIYKRMSVGSDHGDGIVPLASQRWPDASLSFPVLDSDGHLGEPHSQFQDG